MTLDGGKEEKKKGEKREQTEGERYKKRMGKEKGKEGRAG
jgi:hypothetical protein